MSDLISRQDAIDAIRKNVSKSETEDSLCFNLGLGVAEKVVESLPSAEAVEVVRCGECKNRGSDACPMFFEEWFTIDEGDGYVDDDYREHDYTTDEGYCHWGERREDGEADETD